MTGLICFMLICLVPVSLCQGTDLCVKSGSIEDCEATSNYWALDTPELLVTHRFTTTSTVSVYLTYTLTPENSSAVGLCTYEFKSDGTCSQYTPSPNCINCANRISSEGYVNSTVSISNLDSEKNGSIYSVTSIADVKLLQFVLGECPQKAGEATAVDISSVSCGYNCSCQFQCPNRTQPEDDIHYCTAKAEWDSTPSCDAESTTSQAKSTISTSPSTTTQGTESTTSQAESTTSSSSSNATQGSGIPLYCLIVAIVIAVIGFILIVIQIVIMICVKLEVWHFKKEPDGAKWLHLCFAVCVLLLGLAIGLMMGDLGEAACIVGIVIGIISILGMVYIIVLYVREPIETKGIPGKESRGKIDL